MATHSPHLNLPQQAVQCGPIMLRNMATPPSLGIAFIRLPSSAQAATTNSHQDPCSHPRASSQMRYFFADSVVESGELTYVIVQIPEYLASNLSQTLNMRETLFVIWIGTNDCAFSLMYREPAGSHPHIISVGFGNLITGDANPGVTAYTTTRCAVDLISTMHKTGARNFLFLNVSSRSAIDAKHL